MTPDLSCTILLGGRARVVQGCWKNRFTLSSGCCVLSLCFWCLTLMLHCQMAIIIIIKINGMDKKLIQNRDQLFRQAILVPTSSYSSTVGAFRFKITL